MRNSSTVGFVVGRRPVHRGNGASNTRPVVHASLDISQQRGTHMTEGPNTPPMGESPEGGGTPPSGGTPPPPPSGQPTGDGPAGQAGVGEPADLVTRFLAKLIDGVLLGIVYGIVFVAIIFSLLFDAAAGGPFTGGGGFLTSLVTSVIMTALLLGYYAVMEAKFNGQTVGKMLLKLRVVGPTGGTPTIEEAVKRNAYFALGLIGIIPIIGGFIAWIAQLAAVIGIAVTINNNPTTRRGWHDDFAGGTQVLKVG